MLAQLFNTLSGKNTYRQSPLHTSASPAISRIRSFLHLYSYVSKHLICLLRSTDKIKSNWSTPSAVEYEDLQVFHLNKCPGKSGIKNEQEYPILTLQVTTLQAVPDILVNEDSCLQRIWLQIFIPRSEQIKSVNVIFSPATIKGRHTTNLDKFWPPGKMNLTLKAHLFVASNSSCSKISHHLT